MLAKPESQLGGNSTDSFCYSSPVPLHSMRFELAMRRSTRFKNDKRNGRPISSLLNCKRCIGCCLVQSGRKLRQSTKDCLRMDFHHLPRSEIFFNSTWRFKIVASTWTQFALQQRMGCSTGSMTQRSFFNSTPTRLSIFRLDSGHAMIPHCRLDLMAQLPILVDLRKLEMTGIGMSSGCCVESHFRRSRCKCGQQFCLSLRIVLPTMSESSRSRRRANCKTEYTFGQMVKSKPQVLGHHLIAI
jgi:hypothetical protein